MRSISCMEINYHYIFIEHLRLNLLFISLMKTEFFVLLAVLVLQAASLPWKHQIALLNSLEVGRDEDPMTWSCVGCDAATKPIRSHEIKEDVENIRAILSVYEDYTVLAFRYTATIKNVWQDLLWAIQVQEGHAP